MLLQSSLLLHYRVDFPVNVEFEPIDCQLLPKANLTHKSNVVNVLLIVNASPIFSAPRTPVALF